MGCLLPLLDCPRMPLGSLCISHRTLDTAGGHRHDFLELMEILLLYSLGPSILGPSVLADWPRMPLAASVGCPDQRLRTFLRSKRRNSSSLRCGQDRGLKPPKFLLLPFPPRDHRQGRCLPFTELLISCWEIFIYRHILAPV